MKVLSVASKCAPFVKTGGLPGAPRTTPGSNGKITPARGIQGTMGPEIA